MKTIYRNRIKNLTIGITLLTSLSACGPQFMEEYPWMVGKQEEVSQDDEAGFGATDITVLEKELAGAICTMINYEPHAYQYQRSNSVDNYAGYWTTSQNNFTFGGALPTLYTYPNDYLGGPMNNAVFKGSKNAVFHAVELGKPEWRAVALIIQAYVGHETTDFYGSIPFIDWRNVKRTLPLTYMTGRAVYDQIFQDLDEAIRILKERQPEAKELAKIETEPSTLAKGDWRRWVKFANSIRLRMALNMVKADPGTAQAQAEAAVNDEIGVLRIGDRDIAYYYDEGNLKDHPLYFISVSWDDIRLGASLENILKKYDCPLLGVWFTKNTNPMKTASGASAGIGANSDYYGIRQGVAMINKSSKTKGYGPFSVATDFIRQMPKNYFKVAEVIFLRAEGALRGWNMGGSAQDFYEQGIRLAFDEAGVGADVERYLALEMPRDRDYSDPYAPGNNIKGRVSVGVKWNNADTDEIKLEKIITQKYIANFPMGAEAWTTFRRTGYPRLFPVKLNNMPGVDTELQIRRIPLVENENNATSIASMVSALGGPNTGGTRVFWDLPTEARGSIIEPGSNSPIVIPVNF